MNEQQSERSASILVPHIRYFLVTRPIRYIALCATLTFRKLQEFVNIALAESADAIDGAIEGRRVILQGGGLPVGADRGRNYR